MRERRIFDPGLQPERTELAWRRTGLALAAGCLLSMRALSPLPGAWSAAVGLGRLALALAGLASASRRSRRTRLSLLTGTGSLPGGGLLLQTAALVSALAALGLGYAVLS
ncbi:DUF202 domain-containing protein [Actinocorallia populi]|uniref:DUF202 domain-containing protein n=1 Tax=Actinocorallia populi TaxID=2079200 RepID=UPI000D08D411|nr:DUF202 domain-containing protein [Actinocorallia populi]